MTTPLKTPVRTLGETEEAPAPPNPIMGLYEESYSGAGDWYAISGGKPLPDWSGLALTHSKLRSIQEGTDPLQLTKLKKLMIKELRG